MKAVTAEWLRVPGYEQYLEATRDGQVRTIDQHRVTAKGIPFVRKGKVLSASLNKGRWLVYFRDAKSKVHAVPVAVAVASTFIRPLGKNEIIRWRDDNRSNNHVANLEIVNAKRPTRRGARQQKPAPTVVAAEWRPAYGHEAIARVSDSGDVETVDRIITCARGRRRPVAGRRLAIQTNRSGKYVSLRGVGLLLSRLIVESWLRPLEHDETVAHRDGNRMNCHLANLTIVKRQGNNRYGVRRGYQPMRAEVWRPIPDAQYEASNFGRVRSCLRLPKTLMATGKSSRGVTYVGIKLRDGRKTSLSIAKLMRQVWPELAHEWVDGRARNGRKKGSKNRRKANVFDEKAA